MFVQGVDFINARAIPAPSIVSAGLLQESEVPHISKLLNKII